MFPIIDFHTHAFPDSLAERAIRTLSAAGSVPSHLNGTVDDLRRSMDRCGIARSVVCSIATKPSQFTPILEWSKAIRSERIVPFPSVHPADPDPVARVHEVAAAGFRGIKLHPYYQEFVLDDERLFPLYEAVCAEGLVLGMHAGFDMAFPFIDRAGPQRTVNVLARFPALKLVANHLGAWKQWDEVEAHLLGRPVYLDLSYSLPFMTGERARRLILAHPPEYLLFGTDSPWESQEEGLAALRGLGLGEELEARILGGNAATLLGLA